MASSTTQFPLDSSTTGQPGEEIAAFVAAANCLMRRLRHPAVTTQASW
jgi:hypothetical protein